MGRMGEENKQRLERIVRQLDDLDRRLHSLHCTPCSVTEMKLYGLIKRNADLYIQLHITEDYLLGKYLGPQEPPRITIGMGNDDDDDDDDEDDDEEDDEYDAEENNADNNEEQPGPSVIESFVDLWNVLVGLQEFLISRRAIALARLQLRSRCGEAFEVEHEAMTSEQRAREQRLIHILQELEQMGCSREYGSPPLKEIHYYRQIRKRVDSSLALIKAEMALHIHFGSRYCKHKRLWIRQTEKEFSVCCKPVRHRLATAIDRFHEALTLVEECLHSTVSYCSNFLGRNESENQDEGGGNETEIRKSKTQPESSSKGKACLEECGTKKTRKACLQNILALLKKIDASSFHTRPTMQEVRMLAQIEEHVTSSMWISAAKPLHSRLEQGEGQYMGPVEDQRNKDIAEPKDFLNGCHASKEEAYGREKQLQDIVSLVETIKSSYLGISPTAEEAWYYWRIFDVMKGGLLQISKKEVEIGRKRKRACCANTEDLLKPIYDWLRRWLEKVVEDIGGMVKMIIPSTTRGIDETNVLVWVAQNFNFLSPIVVGEFVEQLSVSPQQRLKMLDGLLLLLGKVAILPFKPACKVSNAVEQMSTPSHQPMDITFMEDICAALQILPKIDHA